MTSFTKKTKKPFWNHVVRRRMSPLFYEIISGGQRKQNMKKLLNLNIGFDNFRSIEYDVCYATHEQEGAKAFIEEIYSKEGNNFIKRMLSFWMPKSKELLDLANNIQKTNWKDKTNEDIINTFKILLEKYNTFATSLYFPLFIGDFAENKIKNRLNHLNNKELEQEYFNILTSPYADSNCTRELKDLLKIAIKVQDKILDINSQEFTDLAKAHSNQHGWINTKGLFDDKWAVEELKQRVSKFLKKDCKAELEHLNSMYQKSNKKSEEILINLAANEDFKEFVTLVKKIVDFRTYRMDINTKSGYLSRPLLKEIASRLNLTYNDIIYLLSYEIIDFLTGKTDFTKEIKQRQEAFMYIGSKDHLACISGKVFEDYKQKYCKEDIIKTDEFTGTVANKGYAKGIVRIIKDKSALYQFQAGEILVTSMTRPDFVQVMQDALAIITDEGGITCHAAIVSRELNKPCIIGTKIATKALKNGDMIELDATKGIVRKLNSNIGKVSITPLVSEETNSNLETWGEFTIQKTSGLPLIMSYNAETWVNAATDRYKGLNPVKRFIFSMSEEGNNGVWIVNIQEYTIPAKILLNNITILNNILDDLYDGLEKYYLFLEKLDREEKNIKTNFEEFMHYYSQMYSAGIIFDGFLEYSDTFVNEIKGKYKRNYEKEIIELIEPPKLHFTQLEKRDLLKIALKDKNNQKETLLKHHQNYHWIHNNYKKAQKEDIGFFKKRLDLLNTKSKKEIYSELSKLGDFETNKINKLSQIKAKNIFTQTDFIKLESLGKIALAVDKRKAANLLGNYWIVKYIKSICQEHYLPYNDVVFLLPKELEQITSKQKTLKDFPIKERKVCSAIIKTYKDIKIVHGKAAVKIRETIEPPINEDISTLKGTPASNGIIIGRVKVLNFSTEKEFNQGEILVTSMTRPDFVPHMKKAAAIVTDEGGVTCHAAVISRELKVPCIIGTKIATRVLKDGDMVKVDANKGTIKKLDTNVKIETSQTTASIESNKNQENKENKEQQSNYKVLLQREGVDTNKEL